MWGNLPGWIISLVLAAGMATTLTWLSKSQKVTPATRDATIVVGLAPIVPPANWSTLVPANEASDAGELYRSAIAAYQQDPTAYEAFRQHAALAHVDQLPAIESIVKATHSSSASIFRTKPAELIDYQPVHPSLEACKTLGNITISIGLLHKANRDFDLSRKYLDAGFSLGEKLFEERLTFEELGAGLGLMRAAAQSLENLAKIKGDGGLANAAGKFLKVSDEYRDRLINTYKIVGAIDEDYAGPFAGDIFQIAESATADPMWRVEAIKHLGHYKFNAVNRTDSIIARRTLKRLADDQTLNPAVRTAAVAARDLTIEQHRSSR